MLVGMEQRASHYHLVYTAIIQTMGVMNQHLMTRSLNRGLYDIARELKALDSHLWALLHYKMDEAGTHYIWHTRGDDKVRSAHAVNDGKVFAWENPPDTGHPGEDYGCRCWAEPVNAEEYARQTLISAVNDNPKKWTNTELTLHYVNGGGQGVTLSQIGYLEDVITHYSETLDVYERVNQQIIDRSLASGVGGVTYDFNNTYNFQEDVLFALGNSTVSGVFEGDARKEKGFLVINGIITYRFYDEYKDPASFVERLVDYFDLSREDAEDLVGGSGDIAGTVYPITDRWQTKFNATVALER